MACGVMIKQDEVIRVLIAVWKRRERPRMRTRNLNPEDLGHNEDWEGNNVAFTCPLCGKVFLVSHTRMHLLNGEKGHRKCPSCGKSIGHVMGGRKSGGSASIEW